MAAEKTKKKKQSNGRFRLSVDLRESDENEIQETEREDDSPSRTEMLRRAVKALKAIRKCQNSGGKVIFQDADGKRETLFIL